MPSSQGGSDWFKSSTAHHPKLRNRKRMNLLFPKTLSSIATNQEKIVQVALHGPISKVYVIDQYLKDKHDKTCFLILSNKTSLESLKNLFSFFNKEGVNIADDVAQLWFEEQKGNALPALLNKLSSQYTGLLFLPQELLSQKVPHPDIYRKLCLTLKLQDKVGQESVIKTFIDWGYEFINLVNVPGQMAKRGGILDIFPPGQKNPLRLEWFGGTLDSIRIFDKQSQRTKGVLRSTTIYPATLEFFDQANNRPLFSFFKNKSVLLVENVENFVENIKNTGKNRIDWDCFNGRIIGFGYVRYHDIYPASTFIQIKTKTPSQAGFLVDTITEKRIAHRVVDCITNLQNQGIICVLLLRTQSQKERMVFILQSTNISYLEVDKLPRHEKLTLLRHNNMVILTVCPLVEEGEILEDEGLAFITEQDIFGRKRAQKAVQIKDGNLFLFKDIKPEDLLVHLKHGIGRYKSLKYLKIEGFEQEFIELHYAKGDKLYVPIGKINVLSKYRGIDDNGHELSTLGRKDFERLKLKAKKKIEELARELIKTHAKREVSSKEPYNGNEESIREFESLFPYDETLDQLKAIEDVYCDLESNKLMDRLICGDAGYGKTEVAMRAAFKSILRGEQVAYLVPTTVLAYQHLQTFRDRFKSFPVRIEAISRFASQNNQKNIINSIKTGKVDIIIGTHRLLEKDVTFKKLGLFIVDEEHKFGVGHKERLKRLKSTVNILSLSATPIPRTLYMSISGLKDLSVISTAPSERQKVISYIFPFSESLIKETIEYELNRNGQVFFVYNRINELDKLVQLVRKYFPKARIGIAHARMKDNELEKTMFNFYCGNLDILISTSIVESGLDIPNANTIIIHRADLLGLAQLYQLKGRVGRSNRQGFIYLLIPPRLMLTKQAEERLRAIVEHGEMGSSFELALRDLETRGAGNLLGKEQSGCIKEIGLELYIKLLQETVVSFTDKETVLKVETEIRLSLAALLPKEYILEEKERLYYYKRIAIVLDKEELDDIYEELSDLYGNLPDVAKNLFSIKNIYLKSSQKGVCKLEQQKDGLFFEFHPCIQNKILNKLINYVSKTNGNRLTPEGRLIVKRDLSFPLLEQVERVLDIL